MRGVRQSIQHLRDAFIICSPLKRLLLYCSWQLAAAEEALSHFTKKKGAQCAIKKERPTKKKIISRTWISEYIFSFPFFKFLRGDTFLCFVSVTFTFCFCCQSTPVASRNWRGHSCTIIVRRRRQRKQILRDAPHFEGRRHQPHNRHGLWLRSIVSYE